MNNKVKLGGIFNVICYSSSRYIKWQDTANNLVVDEGLDYILGILLNGNVASDPWYIGLTDGTPTTAAEDSLTGTHAGWTEVTAYSEGARQEFVDNVVSSQSVDNSGTLATFSINADATTIGGAFLADASATGANGTLLCVAAFDGGDKTADSGDTIEVQYTFSAGDDGV